MNEIKMNEEEVEIHMKNILDNIYQTIQETEFIQNNRKKSEKKVLGIIERFAHKKMMADDELSDSLYELLTISEKTGFLCGFTYAVNLLMECGKLWDEK